MPEKKPLTGYPSIDKPWLKYYSEEAIKAPLPEGTMYEYIREKNRDYPNDVALRYYGKKITYGQLLERIKSTASAFWAMGVHAGDIVTIMSMHTPETIFCIYALNYIGAVANMVYMTLAENEIVETVENTESKLFLVLDAALDRVLAIKDKICAPVIVLGVADSMPPHMKLGYRLKAKPKKHEFLTWTSFTERRSSVPPMATDSTAPAVIVYTSGTTGDSKGVLLNSISFNVIAAQVALNGMNYKRGETYLHMVPPFLGFGITMINLPLSQGLDITLWIEIEFDKVAKEFARLKPNRFISGPPIVDPIMKHTKGNLEWLIDFTGGGEAISTEKARQFNDFLQRNGSTARYKTAYGMTEFGSAICMEYNQVYREESVGIPLQQVIVRVVDPDSGKEQTYGEIGELCFCTPNTMIGYYRNEAATRKILEVDQDGKVWVHTGDLGYVDEDGFVFIKGRLKRVYLTTTSETDSTPFKLFPDRIEDLFEAQDGVHLCGVVAKADERRLNVPVAYVECKAGTDTAKLSETLQHVAEKELPKHMQPVAIHILDALPMTASGKVDYRALEEMAKERII